MLQIQRNIWVKAEAIQIAYVHEGTLLLNEALEVEEKYLLDVCTSLNLSHATIFVEIERWKKYENDTGDAS